MSQWKFPDVDETHSCSELEDSSDPDSTDLALPNDDETDKEVRFEEPSQTQNASGGDDGEEKEFDTQHHPPALHRDGDEGMFNPLRSMQRPPATPERNPSRNGTPVRPNELYSSPLNSQHRDAQMHQLLLEAAKDINLAKAKAVAMAKRKEQLGKTEAAVAALKGAISQIHTRAMEIAQTDVPDGDLIDFRKKAYVRMRKTIAKLTASNKLLIDQRGPLNAKLLEQRGHLKALEEESENRLLCMTTLSTDKVKLEADIQTTLGKSHTADAMIHELRDTILDNTLAKEWFCGYHLWIHKKIVERARVKYVHEITPRRPI